MKEHYYDVTVDWLQDRKGIASSTVLDNTIEVVTPPEFKGGISGQWSPEHLFTAAVNSCLMTTFLAIAENSNLHFSAFTSKAAGKLELVDGKYLMTEIILKPEVTIVAEEDTEKALRILNKSEAACLISNSIKSKVTMIPVIHIAASAES